MGAWFQPGQNENKQWTKENWEMHCFQGCSVPLAPFLTQHLLTDASHVTQP